MSESEKKFPPALKLIIVTGVSVCIVLALAIVVLNYLISVRSTPIPSNMDCLNNLRQIDGAAQQFALDKGKKTGDAINYPDDLTPYIKLNKNGKMPSCPQGAFIPSKKLAIFRPVCSLSNTVTPAHVLP
jgi:hypothetical protein